MAAENMVSNEVHKYPRRIEIAGVFVNGEYLSIVDSDEPVIAGTDTPPYGTKMDHSTQATAY